MSHRPIHSVFNFSICFQHVLGVVIHSGLTTSVHVTADILHVKLWQQDIMLDFDWIVQKLPQHHITVTYSKGPKGAHFGPLSEPGGGAAAPPAPPLNPPLNMLLRQRNYCAVLWITFVAIHTPCDVGLTLAMPYASIMTSLYSLSLIPVLKCIGTRQAFKSS